MNNEERLAKMAAEMGQTAEELLREVTFDSVSPGWCVNCEEIIEDSVEPDCSDGHCSMCEENSVKSALVLAGFL